MERQFVKHIIGEMEDMVQRCILCGDIISDYNNCMYPQGIKIKGYDSGTIYVSDGNPKITTIITPPEKYEIIDCCIIHIGKNNH